jgi:hypothetical protein
MITEKQAKEGYAWHENGCKREVGPRGGEKITIRYWYRNGKTQTWKTRPGMFRVPIKHGFRTYWYLTNDNAHEFHTAEHCPVLLARELERGWHEGDAVPADHNNGDCDPPCTMCRAIAAEQAVDDVAHASWSNSSL